jgi:hypothetical protein
MERTPRTRGTPPGARLQRAALEAEQARLVERALREGNVDQLAAGRSQEDDAKRLRGIPCVGGPLGGAIPGTRPDRNRRLDSWSGR